MNFKNQIELEKHNLKSYEQQLQKHVNGDSDLSAKDWENYTTVYSTWLNLLGKKLLDLSCISQKVSILIYGLNS